MTTENLNLLIATLIPVFGGLLAGLVTIALIVLRRKAGIQEAQLTVQQQQTAVLQEANLRDGLNGAMTTGIGMLRSGDKAAALAWVKEKAPQAIAHFALDDVQLDTMLEKKADAISPVLGAAMPGLEQAVKDAVGKAVPQLAGTPA